MNWQPIETAPRDGTVVLTWARHRPNRFAALGHFDANCGDWVSDGNLYLEPTHWMPMPTPPNK